MLNAVQRRVRGVTRNLPALHALHGLGSPSVLTPLGGNEPVLLAAGDYDRAVLAKSRLALHRKWRDARFLRGPQGPFGYRLMGDTFRRLEADGLLASNQRAATPATPGE